MSVYVNNRVNTTVLLILSYSVYYTCKTTYYNMKFLVIFTKSVYKFSVLTDLTSIFFPSIISLKFSQRMHVTSKISCRHFRFLFKTSCRSCFKMHSVRTRHSGNLAWNLCESISMFHVKHWARLIVVIYPTEYFSFIIHI